MGWRRGVHCLFCLIVVTGEGVLCLARMFVSVCLYYMCMDVEKKGWLTQRERSEEVGLAVSWLLGQAGEGEKG